MMFQLPLTAFLALVLAVEVVVPHNAPYRHRHRSRGGSYGQRQSYSTRGVSSLIGKPARVVKVVKVTVPSGHYDLPSTGHIHSVGTRPQHTFGVSHVPTGSFVAPGGASGQGNPSFGVSGPGNPSFGVSGPGNPSFGVSGPGNPSFGVSGPGNPNFGVSGPGNPSFGVSGPGNPSNGASSPGNPSFGVSGPGNPSIADIVDVRSNPIGTGVPGGSQGGSCPPVRASCTTFRTSPPSCTTDDTCFQEQKCCFDACVQRNICKSVV